MKIEILYSAIDDLIEGFTFYEGKSQGLGEYFLDSLYSDIESLHLNAGVHAIYLGYHRSLSKRFPFAIYYKIYRKTVRVFAVLDCRRNPTWIRKKLT